MAFIFASLYVVKSWYASYQYHTTLDTNAELLPHVSDRAEQRYM
jgi:hypothetical protein